MQSILLISLLILFLPISGEKISDHNDENADKYFIKFDNMRLRKFPKSNSETLDFLPLGESVLFRNEISPESITVELGGKETTGKWNKIITEFKETGWIFGPALQKEPITRKISFLRLGVNPYDEIRFNSGTYFYGVKKVKKGYAIEAKKVYKRLVKEADGKQNEEFFI